MAVGKSRRWVYVSTAIAAAVILILAIILLQQPIEPKTTPPPTLTAPGVATIAASGVQETNATLNGNLLNLGSASYSLVGFRYGTDITLTAATNETVSNETAAGAFDLSINGLSGGNAYYFQAWGRGDGFSPGAILTFTTKTPSTSARSPAVATGAASSITISTAMLNGNLTALGTASSVTTGFRYGTSATLVGATNLSLGSMSTTGAFAEQVSGLAPNTTYYVQAWAAGTGFSTGSVRSFTTGTGSGNGHHVPPGWAHAACPSQAHGHGVHARCDLGVTWGELKKGGGSGSIPAAVGAVTGILSLVSLVGSRDRRGVRSLPRSRTR